MISQLERIPAPLRNHLGFAPAVLHRIGAAYFYNVARSGFVLDKMIMREVHVPVRRCAPTLKNLALDPRANLP